MIIERSLPLLKIAAAAGATALGLWLLKKAKAKPRRRAHTPAEHEPRVERFDERRPYDRPWGVDWG
jgi:hypothetical protein